VARLTPTDWKTLKCIFEHAGFSFEREKGDHIVLSRPGTPRPVIIPKYSSIGLDIIKANMRTANMSLKEYFKLLARC
jgi:predicted RNA binding protein YcfA (HicA-like mRNA interferase family)